MTYQEKIEQQLYDNNIQVLRENLNKFDALTIKTGQATGIFLNSNFDYNKDTQAYLLGHEMAHVLTSSFYTFSNYTKRHRNAERKAMSKQVFDAGLNPDKIKKDLQDGMQVWEIAYKYDLPEQLIYDAIDIFKCKYWDKEELWDGR